MAPPEPPQNLVAAAVPPARSGTPWRACRTLAHVVLSDTLLDKAWPSSLLRSSWRIASATSRQPSTSGDRAHPCRRRQDAPG